MPKEMTYEEARSQIKSGDLVFIHRGGIGLRTLLHWFINFFTGSPIYHTAVAIWMETPGGYQRLMCSDTHISSGKRLVPLSIFSGLKMEVVRFPSYANMVRAENYMMERVGSQPYGFWDLLTIGTREFLGLPVKDLKGQVCSELSAQTWVEAGVPLIDTHISPGRLYSNVQKLGLPVDIVITPPKK